MSEENKVDVEETSEAAEEQKKIDTLAEKLVASVMTKMDATNKVEADEKAKAIAEAEMKSEEENYVTFGEQKIAKSLLAQRKGEFKGSDESFVQVGEFVKALLSNDVQKLQIMVEGTAASGGFLVPEQWANTIVEYRDEQAVVRPRATVVPVTTDTFHVPQLASKPKVYWRSETAVKNTSTATFAEITLTPYSLAVIVPLSQELVDDATVGLTGSIINLVTRLITEAIAMEEDAVFGGTAGTGSGRPTGIASYAGITEINAANSLDGDNIIDAYWTLGQGYRTRPGVYWMMSSETMSIVQGLKDSNNRYLFSDALTSGGLPTLKGIPVLEHNNLGVVSIFLGDFSAYWIADRMGIRVRVSDEATVASQSAFERNLVYVRVEERVDGELTDTRAFVEITNAK